MFVGKIIVLISVVAVASTSDGTASKYKIKGNISSVDLKELNDFIDDTGDSVEVPDDSVEEIIRTRKDVEADINAWINHLDCLNTSMGAVKCIMIKKASDNFYKNPKRQYAKMKNIIKIFVNDLREDGHMDKTLEELIKKHGSLLDK